MSKAVIGLGFGDEGKGIVTDFLCSRTNTPMVIRFSGGHQAGHTVICKDSSKKELKHIFSNFGSGTFRGAPTIWSKYCTVDPEAVIRELKVLLNIGTMPELHIHSDCKITTPYDKEANQKSKDCDNGTCGVGFGKTIEREENLYSLRFKDLFSPKIRDIKLELIRKYYNSEATQSIEFLNCCNQITNHALIHDINYFCEPNFIFEGSQGLLLDKRIGFFPHVTRGYTGTKNLLKMTRDPDLYLVTRAYQTRHGNGPMTNESIPNKIKPNPNETNKYHPYQGEFRKSILDIDLLKYAIVSDGYIRGCSKSKVTLAITCLDHVEGCWEFTEGDVIYKFDNEDSFVKKISEILCIDNIIRIRSPKTDDIVA